jgi:hypothetical protein
MARWRVIGTITGEVFIGEFEADSGDEAIAIADEALDYNWIESEIEIVAIVAECICESESDED